MESHRICGLTMERVLELGLLVAEACAVHGIPDSRRQMTEDVQHTEGSSPGHALTASTWASGDQGGPCQPMDLGRVSSTLERQNQQHFGIIGASWSVLRLRDPRVTLAAVPQPQVRLDWAAGGGSLPFSPLSPR